MSLDLERGRYDCLFQVLFGCGNKGYSSAFPFQAGNLVPCVAADCVGTG